MNCAVWILLATCIQFSVCFKSSENSVETADEGVDDVDKLIFAHVVSKLSLDQFKIVLTFLK